MAAHIPGPWTVESADWPDDEPGIVRYYVRHDPPEIGMANAQLIAAAPDLLAAARAALNDRMYKEWPQVADLLIAAIAKAEGR